MVITSITYDGLQVQVNWQPFSEQGLAGYLVTILEVGLRMDNIQVDDPTAVFMKIGLILKAGADYQCWVTPLKRPGIPDTANQSATVPIPYTGAGAQGRKAS
jgi:hypothetical protein